MQEIRSQNINKLGATKFTKNGYSVALEMKEIDVFSLLDDFRKKNLNNGYALRKCVWMLKVLFVVLGVIHHTLTS